MRVDSSGLCALLFLGSRLCYRAMSGPLVPHSARANQAVPFGASVLAAVPPPQLRMGQASADAERAYPSRGPLPRGAPLDAYIGIVSDSSPPGGGGGEVRKDQAGRSGSRPAHSRTAPALAADGTSGSPPCGRLGDRRPDQSRFVPYGQKGGVLRDVRARVS